MYFRDVQHQSRALSIIRRSLASGRLPHALLLEGPSGVGKELAARALAARLLCEADVAPDADACGECPACQLVAGGNHPDLHRVHRGLHADHPDRTIRQSKGLFLVVDIVRHFLIEPAANAPTLGRRRVFIVRDAERMNEGAQNALLKTLEEPPGDATLILVSSSADRLLETIRSRCQRVAFAPLPSAFVADLLTRDASLDSNAVNQLARLAEGRAGEALRWNRIGLLDGLPAVRAALQPQITTNPETFGKSVIEIATALAERAAADDASAPEPDDGKPARGKSSARNVDTDALRDALKLIFMLVANTLRGQLAAAAEPLMIADQISAAARAEQMLDRNVAPQLVCEWLAVAMADAPQHA